MELEFLFLLENRIATALNSYKSQSILKFLFYILYKNNKDVILFYLVLLKINHFVLNNLELYILFGYHLILLYK